MNIPIDWNNTKEWDLYFEENQVVIKDIANYEIEDSLRYFSAVANRKVWVSGCGLELSPWLFSYLNCEVLATDISKTAIKFQSELLKKNPFKLLNQLQPVLDEIDIEYQTKFIEPQIKVADFRNESPNELFDVVLNNNAIQGLSNSDIEKAAKVFFNATEKGGIMISSTMNVQGEKRTEIENAYVRSGYFIANLEAEQWYRKKLEDTGILYVMILGNPMVPQWDQYQNKGGKEQEEKDKEILRSFRTEYQERLQVNYEKDKETYRPEIDKLAYIIYNTG
ncbi:class I SAM-dependent methyltransferase [Dokdonia sp.]|uniref:class I SAM-dependent methyltransferase n=1 Tax=Dokdonia sp. TaxID=2024995 RepID=UPI003267D241